MSKKIADSKALQNPSVLRLCGVLTFCAVLLVTSGCGTPLMYPFFPARTGAEGVVVDQHNEPIPNVEMQAGGTASSWWWVMLPPMFKYEFRADHLGKWHWYRRDVLDLQVQAMPPAGYGLYTDSRPDETEGWIHYGEYRTNVVLRLRKVEPSPEPKETK